MMNAADTLVTCPFESGFLELYNNFIDQSFVDQLWQELKDKNHWNDGNYHVAGRQFTMPRLQTWYADPGVKYNFSYDLHQRRDWTLLLDNLRTYVESATEKKYNSVLINLYRNGNDWVDWHSDNERELGLDPTIASISLGSSRYFSFRKKNTECKDALELSSGSLLVMHPKFQFNWQHAILQDKNILSPRINLTFRYVIMP